MPQIERHLREWELWARGSLGDGGVESEERESGAGAPLVHGGWFRGKPESGISLSCLVE